MALEVFVLTLFPQMFDGIFGESMMKRAATSGVASMECINFRNYATDRHRTVDDTTFGGGAGMLLKPDPLFSAVEDIHDRFGTYSYPAERRILLSPAGRRFDQRIAEEYATSDRLIFLCGHYEGFDDRVRQHLATEELSLGDFVMTGGEIAAMAVVDTVVRLLPGVLGNAQSLAAESLADGLLEYPQFTKPSDFRGHRVPDALLSGNHGRIAEWRHRHAVYRTWLNRPDLLGSLHLSPLEEAWIRQFEQGDFSQIDIER